MRNKYHISRRSFLAGTSATAIGLTFLPFSLRAKDQDQLNFYNWDDYIGEDTLSDFASAVGVKTNIDFFADNRLAALIMGIVFASVFNFVSATFFIYSNVRDSKKVF